MENLPKLSIIMPVYNGEKYLNATVDSILQQTFGDFELILVNDASLDGTDSLCDELCKVDMRIKVIHQSQNMGASAARNTGLDAASGEYITFIDSDDRIDDDLYQLAMDACLKTNAQLVVFGMQEEYFDRDDKFIRSIPFALNPAVMNNEAEVREQVMLLESTTLLGYPWNKIYHLPTLRMAGSRFPIAVLLEDFFFNIDYISKISSMVFVDSTSYHYIKRHGQGQTSCYEADYFLLHYKKVRTLYELHKQWGMFTDRVAKQIANLMVRYTFSALERNTLSQSKMTYGQQREFLNHLYHDELFCTLIRQASCDGALLKIMAWLLKSKNTAACLAVAKAISLVKRLIPNLFLNLKQKR